MKLTNVQARSLASIIERDAKQKLRKLNENAKKAIMPKAKQEAKAAAEIINKLPQWAKKSIEMSNYCRDGVTEKNLKDAYVRHYLKSKNKTVRSDLYNQIIVLSVNCKTIDEIKKKVIVF